MRLHLPMEAPLLRAFASFPDPRKSRNQLVVPPLIGTLGGALIGAELSRSRHVTIQIK